MAFSEHIYALPVPADAITGVVIENDSHQGSYEGSVDFAVPLATPVLAGADGVVVRVRDDSDVYGQDPSYGPSVNYITLEHAGQELSEYLHLAKGSAVVSVGDTVEVGQRIAVTGLSGWLYAPHLHFMVYHWLDKGFQCRTVRFSQELPRLS
jgi:murein DD-endopeptidase MepM/ murein hydrolase activator NlpD